MILNVTCTREDNWWIVEVPGLGVTQARRLDQVPTAAREVAVLMAEDPAAADAEVNIEVVLSRTGTR